MGERNERDDEEASIIVWSRETVPKVMKIVCCSTTTTISSSSSSLSHKDLISLLLVSPSLNRTLQSISSLWLLIDLREMTNAGHRLLSALSLPRYKHVKQISLEFAQDVDDTHLLLLKTKCAHSLRDLESLNLNGCQKISDKGLEAITALCPKLKVFSIYWNVRVTDTGIKHLVSNCKQIVQLNLSGCKNITDNSLQLIADTYKELESLDLTRCVKLTDSGLQHILHESSALQSLNLYALSGYAMSATVNSFEYFSVSCYISNWFAISSFTDKAYKRISLLPNLKFLDLCGSQNLSDEGLSCIAKCKDLVSLNLTWCVRVTDAGVTAVAHGCPSLEFLSLFGIVGVTDRCLDELSRSCSSTLTTLDVNGCIGIKRRSRDELLQLFPHLTCFKVHS
ncbi:hypothetical protein ACFE04_003281 [Oxalis oulophora]